MEDYPVRSIVSGRGEHNGRAGGKPLLPMLEQWNLLLNPYEFLGKVL